jgi:hypothetical protein
LITYRRGRVGDELLIMVQCLPPGSVCGVLWLGVQADGFRISADGNMAGSSQARISPSRATRAIHVLSFARSLSIAPNSMVKNTASGIYHRPGGAWQYRDRNRVLVHIEPEVDDWARRRRDADDMG